MRIRVFVGLLPLALLVAVGGCVFDGESDKESSSLSIDGYVRDGVGSGIQGVEMSVYLDGGGAAALAPTYSTFTNGAKTAWSW